MIYDNLEFHNIDQLKDFPEGKRLQRVPEKLRLKLNQRAQQQMLAMAGAEIRFVSRGEEVKIHLKAETECELIPFRGMFQGNKIKIKGEETVKLKYPERLKKFTPETKNRLPFNTGVCRLVLRGGPLFYQGIEGEIRLPYESELPGKRYLAYGTSITHGAASTGIHLSYVSQTARRLQADLINLGVGGAAHCEPELADYIAQRHDWDFATLSLSVNMVGGFSEQQFTKRVSYMVKKIAETGRPVFAITIFPYFNDFKGASVKEQEKVNNFRQILRDVVSDIQQDNLHLLEGSDLLTDIGGLSGDLIHPADNGMIQMGQNLAEKIKPLI